MVFNRRTYPNFCRLLEILEVTSQSSDMSFSVRADGSGLEYQGSSLNGVFAQRSNILRPSFLRMLRDIARFNRLGNAAAATSELKDGRTVGEFLPRVLATPGVAEAMPKGQTVFEAYGSIKPLLELAERTNGGMATMMNFVRRPATMAAMRTMDVVVLDPYLHFRIEFL